MVNSKKTKEDLSKIRNVRILDILGIKPTLRKLFIRCPVHNENTGSFCIFPDGSYHCFGCGINGQNAIDFLIALGASFPEALEELDKYIS